MFPALADDAMISMRYGWHLAHGEGLVYNPGERVEGYTNLLWTLVMAAAIAAFGSRGGALAISLLGVVLCLACAAVAARLARALAAAAGADPGAAATTASLLVLACFPLAHWAIYGMETTLLALLLCLAAERALQTESLRPPSPAGTGLGGLLALLVWTRADAALPAAVVVGFLLWRPRSRRAALVAAAACAAALAAHALFRLGYYGDVVPNTARLKLDGIPLAARLQAGAAFGGEFAASYGPAFLVLLAGAWRGRRGAALAAALWAVAGLYLVWVGGDAFPHHRLVVLVLPITFAACAAELALAARALLERAARRGARPGSPAQLAVLLALPFVLWSQRPDWTRIALLDEPAAAVYASYNTHAYLDLSAVLGPQATLGVIQAGTLPYYGAHWRTVDFLGKVDPHVARLAPDLSGAENWFGSGTVPGHNKYDLRYSILERRPSYVQTAHWGTQALDLAGLYVRGWRRGRGYLLRKDDPAVNWDALDAVTPLPGAPRH